MNRAYAELPVRDPHTDPETARLYSDWLGADGAGGARPGRGGAGAHCAAGPGAAALLHTQYHAVEQTVIPELEKW